MNATNARIILTSRVYERLETLLAALPADSFPGKAAFEAELGRAEIVEPDKVLADVVTMNSTVRFTMTDSATPTAYRCSPQWAARSSGSPSATSSNGRRQAAA